MVGRGSLRLSMLLAKASQKKISPKGFPAKKHGGSPRGMQPREKSRAFWNPLLEKTLVELLHDHNNCGYKGENGWSSEAWNKIVKEFHERNVSFMKAQIQEKEKELKRDYKMLKESMMQSGVHWNGETCMIEADTTIWDNIITSNSKAKKFRTKSFPLFKALGELYDGHLAEGTYNFTSTEPPKYPLLRQIENADEQETNAQEVMFPDLEESFAYEIQNEDEVRERNEEIERNEERQRNEERPQRRAAIISRNKYEKEPKRPKKSANIEGMMEKYLNMRTKQAEEELHS